MPSDPRMRILTLEGLSRRYGAVQALDDVSVQFRSGEVHALMGENGAGKSTLIKLIAGLEAPDSGHILLDDKPLVLASAAEAHAAGLRFIHQELHTVPALSVAENMHLNHPYPRRFGLVDWRVLNAVAQAALARLRLDHIDPASPMSRLGSGDQMLVRIAATLVDDSDKLPWLYVMDEPTAALTGVEAEALFAVIDQLRTAGAGVIYVSHRMAEVMRLSDRVSVLRDGKLVSSLPIAQTDERTIIHDMTGRDLSALFPPRSQSPAGGVPCLEIEGLSAGRLQGISLTVQKGEILGIAGLAGSGRGALLQALVGALPWRAGRLTLDGRPVPTGDPAAGWARGLAYVPRERRSEGLMMLSAIADNVTLPHLARLSRWGVFLDRRAERMRVDHHGSEVRLKSSGPAQPVVQLSGGNQQKVLFARALAGQPSVLLLDEPTRGVDIGAKFDIYRLIRRLADDGISIILASSDLPELLGLSDRIAVLQDGRLVHVLHNDALSEADLLELCYDQITQGQMMEHTTC